MRTTAPQRAALLALAERWPEESRQVLADAMADVEELREAAGALARWSAETLNMLSRSDPAIEEAIAIVNAALREPAPEVEHG